MIPAHNEQDSDTPRLLLDATVGRLVRWLRLLGYNTEYASTASPADMLRVARSSGRILVTRSHRLGARQGFRVVITTSPDVSEQVCEVAAAVGRLPAGVSPRCPACNHPLVDLPREAARSRVPPYVWRTTQTFAGCEQCGRVFWPGTQWQAIRKRLDELDVRVQG
jgi:hypothetical protein